jgi:hypothetical protein
VLREVVDSSSLKSIGYDRRAQTLEIEFANGSVYLYQDVPIALWTEFRHSASKGKFFQEQIRDRFATTRV